MGRVSWFQMSRAWLRLRQHVGASRLLVMTLLVLSGVFGVSFLGLRAVALEHSGLLYLLIPYSLSLALAWFKPYGKSSSVMRAYGKHLLSTLIVFLGTSILLQEGYICMLMFLPIYLAFVTIAFLIYGVTKRNRVYSTALPAMIIVLSMEGTMPFLTFERDTSLTIFPMPVKIEAGSLAQGDVHRVHTQYKRWFFTNVHEGVAEFEIVKVSDHHIQAKYKSDTTYFSSYLTAKEINIYLRPVSDNETVVSLSIDFERKLDPAWYFDPLQRYAVEKMAEFTIKEVINRGSS